MVTIKKNTREIYEHKLKSDDQAFEFLIENSLNGIAYCRMIFEEDQPKDFVYIFVNKSFERLTGLKNVVGRKVSEVIPGILELDRDLINTYGRVARSGKTERFEEYLNSLDMWFSVAVYSPGLDHFIVIFEVITERKKQEEARRKAEEKLKAIFKILPVGVAIVDKERRFLEVNTMMEKILGFSKKELAQAAQKRRKYLHSNGLPMPIKEFPLIPVLNGEGEMHDFEMGVIQDDGSVTWIIMDAVYLEGVGAIVCNADITKLKKLNDDLQKYKERLELAQHVSNAAAWDWNIQSGQIEWTDKMFDLFGLDKAKDQVSFESWRNVIHPEDIQGAQDRVDQALKDHLLYEHEYRISNLKEGQTRWIRARGQVYYDDNNRPMRMLGICVDVTEYKKNETVIKGYMDKLEENRKSLEQKNLALKEILEQIQIEKNKIIEYVERNVNDTILPQLDKLKLKNGSGAHIDLLKKMLKDLTSSFGQKITTSNYKLSPREIEICSMIKEGLTSKEISGLLNISSQTVEKHRKNIRKKLQIVNKGINFQAHLNSI